MTATEVDGRKVVSDEPTPAPIRARDGSAIYFQQTRTLTLDDGSSVYGCLHCDYTTDVMGAIRPHLKVHKPDGGKRGGNKTVGVLAGALAKMETERDEWKTRARKAERDLANIRKALRG